MTSAISSVLSTGRDYAKRTARGGAQSIRAFPGYARAEMRHDAQAGLTVAVMGVPQAMAYALIAGVPPVYGLYTAIVTCSIAAITGSSRHLVTGPTNAMCMVILSLTAHLTSRWNLLEMVFLLTVMTGAIQLVFGLLRLGGIVRYVSNSVVVGFTAGAGILIAGNQLANVMGVTINRAHAERFHEILWQTASLIPETNWYALGIGVWTALAVLLLPRLHRRIPSALVGVGVSAALVWFFGWHDAAMGEFEVRVVGDIGEGVSRRLDLAHLPHYLIHPDYELTRELGGGAFALAILGLIEAASIARAVAASTGQRIDFNREFTGQGLSNLAGGFMNSFAGSGSFTRTAVNFAAGARTRGAAVFSAGWTALTIVLLAPVANYIPIASLAGMLIIIAYTMIEKHRLRLAWTSSSQSRAVLASTFVATLILPLEYAIFVGVFLSIVFLLKITGRTDLTQLVPRQDGGFDEVPFNRAAPSQIAVLNMEGDLYFAAVEDLDYEMQRVIRPATRVVVLRMKRLRAVGSTAMAILEHFNEVLHGRNIQLVVCGLEGHLTEIMTRSGLRERIGEPNIFYADNKLFQSTELAMARAMSLVRMAERREASREEVPAEVSGLTARDLVTRNCIRFGRQHQVREAVWLLSEMVRRQPGQNAPPLFLQNREGKLAGVLSMWRLLEALAEPLAEESVEDKSDTELGVIMSRRFPRLIKDLAREDVPRPELGTPLGLLLKMAVDEELRVLPVCDDGGRVIGLIGEADLLSGLGRVLHMSDEAETPGVTATKEKQGEQ